MIANTRDIARLRLANQRLVGAGFARPEQVVAWLGAVQSQDYAGATWAVAQRTRRRSETEVEAAFQRGAILRTHVLRPTWHFVLPEDIRWLLALTAPRVRALMAHYDRKLDIDAGLLRRTRDVFTRALRDGAQLTREQLAAALASARIQASGQRLGQIVMHAELDALICSGPRRGKQFTYALLDERAPATRPRDRDEALAELVRRYFASHGPALAQDFAWWSGLTVTDAKRGLELNRAQIEHARIDDRAYWCTPARKAARNPRPRVHLLPNYDEHVASYKDYSPSFDSARVRPPKAGDDMLYHHIVTLDGQIIGGWRRTLAKDHVLVDVRLLTQLDARERGALQDAIAGYGEYLRLRAVSRVNEPRARLKRAGPSRSVRIAD